MRKLMFAVLVVVAGVLLTAAGPAAATPPEHSRAGGGWEPVHYEPYELPAGVRCDFPVRGEPIVNQVRKRVLETYPDGSPKREAYTGDLVMRITNLDSGAHTDVDASGDAVIEYREDGSMIWYVKGPVLVGIGENGGNLPRGIWRLDGVYTVEFSSTGYRTVTMARGTTHDVCTDVD